MSTVLQIPMAMDSPEMKMYSLTVMDVLLAVAREGDVARIERLVRPEVDIDTRGRREELPNTSDPEC